MKNSWNLRTALFAQSIVKPPSSALWITAFADSRRAASVGFPRLARKSLALGLTMSFSSAC
jgi:hypothetical protein